MTCTLTYIAMDALRKDQILDRHTVGRDFNCLSPAILLVRILQLKLKSMSSFPDTGGNHIFINNTKNLIKQDM